MILLKLLIRLTVAGRIAVPALADFRKGTTLLTLGRGTVYCTKQRGPSRAFRQDATAST